MAKDPTLGPDLDTTLTDEVLMPGTDYKAICNAVRVLTGGTAALKSGDIAPALAGVKPVKTLTGTWIPAEDTAVLDIAFEGGAKCITLMAQINSLEDIAEKTWTGLVFAEVSGAFIFNCAIAGKYISDLRGSTSNADNTSGITLPQLSATILWRAGITYKWTAYYWDQEAQG